MKGKYIVLYILTALSFAVTGVFLFLMPDAVPIHFNAEGTADSFGSKYTYLLLPLTILFMSTFFLLIAKHNRKKGDTGSEKVVLWSAIATVAFLNVLYGYSMYTAIPQSHEINVADSICNISAIGLGAVLMVIGNIMPKSKLNSLTGLRTVWSMKNEEVWRKSQRFGGISTVICGLAMIIVGILASGCTALLIIAALLTLNVIISTIMSYIFCKENHTDIDSRN